MSGHTERFEQITESARAAAESWRKQADAVRKVTDALKSAHEQAVQARRPLSNVSNATTSHNA